MTKLCLVKFHHRWQLLDAVSGITTISYSFVIYSTFQLHSSNLVQIISILPGFPLPLFPLLVLLPFSYCLFNMIHQHLLIIWACYIVVLSNHLYIVWILFWVCSKGLIGAVFKWEGSLNFFSWFGQSWFCRYKIRACKYFGDFWVIDT